MNVRTYFFYLLLSPLIGACVTAPVPANGDPGVAPDASTAQRQIDPFIPPARNDAQIPMPVPRAINFEELPGWDEASLTNAVEAFSRSCERWRGKQDTDPVSSRIRYAGTVGEWRPSCAAIDVVEDSESARRVFEALFTPLEVLSGETTPRFTGYFEPEIEARQTPVFPYTQPIPGLPDAQWALKALSTTC